MSTYFYGADYFLYHVKEVRQLILLFWKYTIFQIFDEGLKRRRANEEMGVHVSVYLFVFRSLQ